MAPRICRQLRFLFWGPRHVGRVHGVAGVCLLGAAFLDSWLSLSSLPLMNPEPPLLGGGLGIMAVLLSTSAINASSALVGLVHLPKLLPEFLYHGAIMQMFFVAFSIRVGMLGDRWSNQFKVPDVLLSFLYVTWIVMWMLPSIARVLFSRMNTRERRGMLGFLPVALFHLVFNLWQINFACGALRPYLLPGGAAIAWWDSLPLLARMGYVLTLEKSILANALGSIVITIGYRGIISWTQAIWSLLASYLLSTLLLLVEWRRCTVVLAGKGHLVHPVHFADLLFGETFKLLVS